MRYRRDNKKIIEKLKLDHEGVSDSAASLAETSTTKNRATQVAATAASMPSLDTIDIDMNTADVHNPLGAVANSAALDAAARLADAATVDEAAVAAATAAVSQDCAEV
jgi:hypothetical protein